MKNKTRILIITLILVFLAIPSLAKDNPNLTILFTHDMHDNLEAAEIKVNNKIESRGGFARLSTAISEERERDKDLLLVDAGDYSMGTLFQTIFTSHSPALRLMGELGYDATTFGNHEFDFRTEGLASSLESAVNSGDRLPEIVASNTEFPAGKLSNPLENLKNSFEKYGVKDYLVLDKKGIKIGIIGLMGEDADSNAPMAEVEFTNIVDRSKELVQILKDDEEVDLIVALSHTGTAGEEGRSEDEVLAQEVPEIDVIISGHSHTKLPQPIIIKDTIIASSGNYTENLGYMNIEKDGDRWKLKEYQLKEINDSYDKDQKIKDLIKTFRKDVEDEYLSRFNLGYDEVIAYSDFSFTPLAEIGKVQEEEPLGYLISDAYRYAVERAEKEDYRRVDLAVVASGVIRDSFTQGEITVKDAFQVSSLGVGKDGISGYPLIDVYLNGKEIKTVAEVDASVQPMMGAAQLYVSGLKYSFNPNRIIFNKVTDVKLDREDGDLELEDDKLYRVVANLYTGQMLDEVKSRSKNLLSIVPKDENGNEIEDFEDRIIYNDGEEVKEWLALTQYLQSFPKKHGVPHIPKYYSEKQGRKIINYDKDLVSILEKPNMISIGIIGLPLILLIIIILLIRFLIRRRRKKKSGQDINNLFIN